MRESKTRVYEVYLSGQYIDTVYLRLNMKEAKRSLINEGFDPDIELYELDIGEIRNLRSIYAAGGE